MIASIRLQNYRTFLDSSFEFERGVNIIIGPNASGKTNLLEAILVIAIGSSYRSPDKDLIAKEHDWARLDAVTNSNIKHSVLIKNDPHTHKTVKEFTVDGSKYKRLMPNRRMPVVIFEPNQLLYITTSPELRRSLIDNLSEQINISFAQTKRSYSRALAQRNALLKMPNPKNKLFAWDVRLSELASNIVEQRLKIIDIFNQTLSSTYSKLAGHEHSISVRYDSKCKLDNYANDMLNRLSANAQKDIERGFTSIGPHRDDIEIKINDRGLQAFASRGETRTLLLAIKIQEAITLEEKFKQKAIMLLDDVFGELDGKRRKALTTFLQSHQAFITTTDADIASKGFTTNANSIAL